MIRQKLINYLMRLSRYYVDVQNDAREVSKNSLVFRYHVLHIKWIRLKMDVVLALLGG